MWALEPIEKLAVEQKKKSTLFAEALSDTGCSLLLSVGKVPSCFTVTCRKNVTWMCCSSQLSQERRFCELLQVVV